MSERARRGVPALRIGVVAAMLAGGGLGATARYGLANQFAPPTPPDFPWITFLINVGGAFSLGAVMTLLATAWLQTRYVKPFVATGVLGGFTTWSHFITEADQLIGAHQAGLAILYVTASVVLGVLAAAGGAALAEALIGRHGTKEPR